ncbi:aminotransferase class I/II-fold pyridoxal phosphate-dependent enzyme [Nanchangia anserum]|uniref:cysteine-S-conjugate beta-lyase n=1 Tax=Nanchangia anserum TaxID=2692125 RepID=A0A8I0G9X4_9ACTO|nr:aminotransferase class I/II-fold pyridoxal phosphate-dependent enzyme [Nanchangia anserum]MBD3688903.1 aminotransferase class I/II-fold pyridoxal phosphate-dependent enzyme [Nanchangia anserum]QOX81167.1 aminotransferase class I/II-fold pyridoxal phosphate-dependent enzyme [Nanchangia anserum]
MTPTDNPADLVATWDRLTVTDMYARGGCKWSQRHPDTGEVVLGAGVAEHDLGLPAAVRVALHRLVEDGTLGYPPPGLADAAIEAFCGFAATRYGWTVAPEAVTLTGDVLSILRAQILTVTNPGDAIVVPTPAYWVFRTIPEKLDRRLVEVPSLRQGGRWVLDTDRIAREVDAGARLVILCNPWNPTGRVLSHPELEAFADATVARGAWVFADEIHAPLTLPGHTHVPFTTIDRDVAGRTVVAMAASKAFNTPGLRCAQAIIEDRDVAALMSDPLARYAGGASTPGIVATERVYAEGVMWLDAACRYIDDVMSEVRDSIGDDSGIVMDVPEATYISLWDCRDTARADAPFAAALDHGVMGNDGAGVGRGYESYLRLNFGTGRAPARDIAARVIEALTESH